MAEAIYMVLGNIYNLSGEGASSGVCSQLEELQSLLIQLQERTIYDFLYENDRVLRQLDEVRYLAYDIDGRLDTFLINVESHRRVRSRIPMVFKRLAFAYHEYVALRKVESLIRDVKIGISHLGDLDPSSSIEGIWIAMNHCSYNFKEHFIGRTEDIEALVHRLTTKGEGCYPFFEIPGLYGMGKASLGRRIYNHIDIRRCFEAFAWVNPPEDFKREKMWREMLKQLLSYDHKKDSLMLMEEEALRMELLQVFTEMKCLIVLDAEGSHSQTATKHLCDRLYEMLKVSNSQILTIGTSFGQPRSDSRFLDGLSGDEGWELLKTKALLNQENGHQIDPELERIGRGLVSMCDHNPLLISLVGGVLSVNNLSIDHWTNVKEYIIREKTRLHDPTAWIILPFSFNHLPIHLRACFLLLRQFPADKDINVEILYQMWIAEGIVSCVGEETSMEVAEGYLAELAIRSLIQVQVCEFSAARKFVSFGLHAFVREYALDFGNSRDPYRLSVYLESSGEFFEDGDSDTSKALESAPTDLRSLLLRNATGIWRVWITFPQQIYKRFQLLRVLRMENCEIKGGKLPKDIRHLIHLRLLSLNGSAFEELPSSIGKLQFLQTLDLRVAEIVPRGIVLPNVLWKLKRLRHLYLPVCHLVPKGQGKLRLNGLSKLETLVNFDDEKDELADSEWMNLRNIDARVRGDKSISAMMDRIKTHGHKLKETYLQASFSGSSSEESPVPMEDVFNCSKLHHLTVTWGRCELSAFEIPNPFSSNLVEFCLMRCQIREDPMQTLGKFPQLRKLVLGRKSFVGKQMTCEANSFPELRSLKLSNLMHLEKLVISESSMPNLSCLEINCGHKLEMIPDGLRSITKLEELKLTMHKEFNDRVRVVGGEGVDFYKVRHVPLISFVDW